MANHTIDKIEYDNEVYILQDVRVDGLTLSSVHDATNNEVIVTISSLVNEDNTSS